MVCVEISKEDPARREYRQPTAHPLVGHIHDNLLLAQPTNIVQQHTIVQSTKANKASSNKICALRTDAFLTGYRLSKPSLKFLSDPAADGRSLPSVHQSSTALDLTRSPTTISPTAANSVS